VRVAVLLVAFGLVGVSWCEAEERADPPAQVRLRFQDEQGTPVPGVRVRFVDYSLPAQPPEQTLIADAQGELKFQLVRPDHVGSLTWDAQAVAERPGYEPATVHFSAFPDARIDEAVTLRRLRTTLIRLRGPQDEPLAHVPLKISRAHYSDRRNLVTNDRGECEWLHGDLPHGFQILGRPEAERFQDGLVVTVRYDAKNLPASEREVQGTLLQADGSVAAGWLVARRTWFDLSGGFTHGPMWNFMEVEDLRPVGPEGQFAASVAQYLVIVSPEGIPFLYELAPRTWPPGIRQVTLRIPPLRSTHQGRVVDADGKPVADLPIEIESIAWRSENWRIRLARHDQASRERLTGAVAADGSLVGRLHTKADGRYALPIWYGTSPTARGYGDDWTTDGNTLEWAPQSVWRARDVRKEQPYKNKRPYKDVVVVFEDEQGQVIPGLQGQPVVYLANGQRGDLLGTGRDSRGLHAFVEPVADRIELDVSDFREKWSPFQTTIDVEGEHDRVARVRPDASKRRLPLGGRVLNPDGQAARNARLFLYRTRDESRGVPGPDYLQLSASTDADGRFHFDAAPDRCLIEMSRLRDDSAETVKGWIGTVAVDRQDRDLTIRLLPGGRVKILLPEGIGTDADGLYLERENAADDEHDRHGSVSFRRSADRTQLWTPVVRPGRYHLNNYDKESAEVVGALGTIRVDLRPDQESVLDLRDRKLPARRPAVSVVKDWHTITVRLDEQAFSGAEVSVLESIALPEQLAGWVSEATSAATAPAVKKAAIEMLKNSGALAVDAIRAAGKSEPHERLVQAFNDISHDGFRPELLDITDRAGQVRCQLEPGRQCVAVARVRGRLIGWKAFIAGEQDITVDLQPARTLEVRWLQVLPMEEYERPVFAGLRPAGPMDPGLRGLMSSLCDPYDRLNMIALLKPDAVREHRYSLQWTGRGSWSVEDLPVGMQGMVRLSRADGTEPVPPYQWWPVVISAGDGVEHVVCPQSAFSWDTLSRRLSTWWYELRY
jgi:hypothetical protein